jgi:hypothetical protein
VRLLTLRWGTEMTVSTNQGKTGIPVTAELSIKSSAVWRLSSRNVATLTYTGHDATAGVTFFRNPSNIFLSTDNGATISSGKGLPTGVTNGFTISRVVRAFDLWWIVALDAGDTLYKVYSAPVVLGNGALTWTARHTLGVGATNISGALGVSSDGLTLLVAEYSSSASVPGVTGGNSIYRTTDGTTFDGVDQRPAARHYHGVWEDPYSPGVWYALIGDGTATPLLRSSDNGATFDTVASVVAGWDGVAMSFSANYIWVTGDVTSSVSVAPFYVLDRATLTPQHGCTGSPYSTPVINAGVFATGSVTSGSPTLAMGSLENPLTVDDIGRQIIVKKTSDASLLVASGTTITDVSGANVTMSNNASATSSAITYMVDRNERYYPVALNGAVDPTTEVFYLHADNAGAAPIGNPLRFGLFACPSLFGPLVWLENLQSASILVEVVSGVVLTGINYRPTLSVSQAVL